MKAFHGAKSNARLLSEGVATHTEAMKHCPDPAWTTRCRLVACTLGLASFLTQFDVTSVVVVAPTIGMDLGIRGPAMAWIIDAYSIAFTSALLVAGVLADRFGRRRALLFGNAGFLLASLFCGLAWDSTTFLLSRAIQGCSAAFLVTGAISSIAIAFPDPKVRARVFGLLGVISGVAMALGPSLGGLISSWLGWRWVFLLNLPLCGLILLAVPRFVAESRNEAAVPLDWPGVVTLTLALVLVIEGLLQARHSPMHMVFGLAIGAGLLVFFAVRQSRQQRPMLDPAVFASRAMTGVTALLVSVSVGYWAVLVYLPLFLGTAFGWTVQEAGMALLAATLPMLVIPPFGGRIAVQVGWRQLFAIALTIMAIGGAALVLAAVTVQTTPAIVWAFVGMVTIGIGASLANPQLSGAVVTLAPPQASGMASAITVIAKQGGFALGVAALGGLLPVDDAAAGFLWPFCLATAASACGAFACLLLPSARTNRHRTIGLGLD